MFELNKGKVQSNSYGSDAPAIRCYHYKKEGHTRKSCLDRSKSYGDDKNNGNETIV